MKSSVALVIIFNHRYDKNIQILNNLYKHRFSNIFYLVPFYDGCELNVIPVFDNSFYFQGYIAQGFKSYFKEEFEHYIFIGDDLILNPSINQENYKSHFNLTTNSSFITEIHELHNLKNNNSLRFLPTIGLNGKHKKWHWDRIRDAISYKHWVHGVENDKEFPTFNDAVRILDAHGFKHEPITFNDAYGGLFPISISIKEKQKQFIRYLLNFPFQKKHRLRYPLVGAYSDIVIVSGQNIKTFAQYCGAFAANKLFVEFAIPTALLLSSPNVVTQQNTEKQGEVLWCYTQSEQKNYNDKLSQYNNELANLMSNFPSDKLYIHPIKLSKWKV